MLPLGEARQALWRRECRCRNRRRRRKRQRQPSLSAPSRGLGRLRGAAEEVDCCCRSRRFCCDRRTELRVRRCGQGGDGGGRRVAEVDVWGFGKEGRGRRERSEREAAAATRERAKKKRRKTSKPLFLLSSPSLSSPFHNHQQQKLAQICYTRALALSFSKERNSEKNGGKNLSAFALCPGSVKTDMSSQRGSKSPVEGADTAVWLALSPGGAARSGAFYGEREVLDF